MESTMTANRFSDFTPQEQHRLEEAHSGRQPWRLWGAYLSERQWGTVREDYSPEGAAWDDFPHEQARSRAYRWGEDGLAGFSDNGQRLCLGLALWNGRDRILKERLFGLTNAQGNHGEDVKELYYYLDGTPTHAYMKMLYKYPQRPFPYAELLAENARRGAREPEYELLDTGVFDDDRYWDVFVEYAKAGPRDILMCVTAVNRGPDPAELHILPQIWFRNTWSWGYPSPVPELQEIDGNGLLAQHPDLGEYLFRADGEGGLLFTDNETNRSLLWNLHAPGPFKDAFHEYIINGNSGMVHSRRSGTKAAALRIVRVQPGAQAMVRIRLSASGLPENRFDQVLDLRRQEADEFYRHLQHEIMDPDARLVQRQAYAGMIWSQQFFYLDVPQWLNGDPAGPPPPESRKKGRNTEWAHLNNADIISMPDKWEYPWYAAWDLAFHAVALAAVDPEFAKEQLVLITRECYMHPNGQLPAYEWAFGDVNPPVHGWATWRVFQIDRKQRRDSRPDDPGDLAFLERVFHKLMLNFTWWVNRKDSEGRNIFQGGFLGLDNIGVFDRSAPLPTLGHINQSDCTGWMAMYCLNLMRIALELARHNHVYEDIATKFFEHFLQIAGAMTRAGGEDHGLWDDQDGFFYDVLDLPGHQMIPLRIRSMVGLIPLFAVETLEPSLLDQVPEFKRRLEGFLHYRPDLAALVSRWQEPGMGERRLLSLLRGSRMKKLLRRMLDESEFLSDYGVRALSRCHREHPYIFHWNGQSMHLKYNPGESDCGVFGGNSNWRGPIWFPVNYLIIESLQKFHHYYGDDFRIECPTGSGRFLTIAGVADELSTRLQRIFLRGPDGRRPVAGNSRKQQEDPHFRDLILFHEYFHGDLGRGVGASHQTGWTGLVAKLIQPRSTAHAGEDERKHSVAKEP
jgi:hypothetical protein